MRCIILFFVNLSAAATYNSKLAPVANGILSLNWRIVLDKCVAVLPPVIFNPPAASVI